MCKWINLTRDELLDKGMNAQYRHIVFCSTGLHLIRLVEQNGEETGFVSLVDSEVEKLLEILKERQ